MRILLVLLACLPEALVAQATYFGAIDQGPEWGTPWLVDVSMGPDGHLSLLEKGMPDPELGGPFRIIVSGFSFEDGVMWRKRFELLDDPWMGAEMFSIVRLSNGETLVLGRVPGAVVEDYFLLRLGVDGSTIGTARFSLLDPVDEDFSLPGPVVHELANGSIVFSMSLALEPVFVHWSGGPEVDWARSYRPFEEELKKCPAFDFAVLQDGGMLLTMKAYTTMYLVRLDADGAVVWSRNYLEFHAEHFNAVELSNGDIAICGWRALFPFVARLDAQGNMLWVTHLTAEHADYIQGGGFKRIIERSNGDLLVGVNNYMIGAPARSGSIRLNGAGQALDAISLQEQYDGSLGIVEHHGDLVVLAGQATMEIDDEAHRVIPIARFDPITTGYCLVEEDPITQETRSVTNVVGDQCIVREHTVSISSLKWTIVDLIAPAIITCDFHNDVPERTAPGTLLITPSLVERGGSAIFDIPHGVGPLTVEVLDMAGRIVIRSQPDAFGRVALNLDLVPGSYSVCVKDVARGSIASGRVVVR